MDEVIHWFSQFSDARWFIGQVIAIVIAVIVLRLSSRDLRKEAANLRFLVKLVLDALEHKGFARVNRDASGNPTGIVLNIKAQKATELNLDSDPPEAIINPVD